MKKLIILLTIIFTVVTSGVSYSVDEDILPYEKEPNSLAFLVFSTDELGTIIEDAEIDMYALARNQIYGLDSYLDDVQKIVYSDVFEEMSVAYLAKTFIIVCAITVRYYYVKETDTNKYIENRRLFDELFEKANILIITMISKLLRTSDGNLIQKTFDKEAIKVRGDSIYNLAANNALWNDY